jgi:hypothetical protein
VRQRYYSFPVLGQLTALAATGALSLAAIAAVTSPDQMAQSGALERELAAISERSEEIAAFERNIHPVGLDAPRSRAVPFAGFLKSDAQLKPGRRIALARTGDDAAKLEVLDVRRITQTANVIRPASLKMNLLLVKGRIIETGETAGDRVLPRNGLEADDRIVHLLFAVGAISSAPKPSGLATPPAQHSL